MAKAAVLPGLWVKLTRPQMETVQALCEQEADGLEEMDDHHTSGYRRRVTHLRQIAGQTEAAMKRTGEEG